MPGGGWRPLAIQVLFANLAMAAALWMVAGPLDVWLDAAWHARALRLAGCIGLGIGVYLVALLALGLRPRHLRGAAAPRAPSRSV
jgi:putative peptidoglycan lipid II flippase